MNRQSTSKLKNFIRHRGTCNLILIAINIVVFIWLSIIGDVLDPLFMAGHGAVYVPWVMLGNWWTLFTSMFLHFGIDHIAGNLIVLFFIGDNLERAVGSVRFLIIYLGGGLIGNLVSFGVEFITEDYSVSAGASGAIFAVVGALLYIVIRNHGKLEDMTTTRILLMVAYSLYSGFTDTGINNSAHIGGLLGGFLFAVLLYTKKQMALTSERLAAAKRKAEELPPVQPQYTQPRQYTQPQQQPVQPHYTQQHTQPQQQDQQPHSTQQQAQQQEEKLWPGWYLNADGKYEYIDPNKQSD